MLTLPRKRGSGRSAVSWNNHVGVSPVSSAACALVPESCRLLK